MRAQISSNEQGFCSMIHDSIVAVVVITAVDYIKNMEVPRNFVSTVY